MIAFYRLLQSIAVVLIVGSGILRAQSMPQNIGLQRPAGIEDASWNALLTAASKTINLSQKLDPSIPSFPPTNVGSKFGEVIVISGDTLAIGAPSDGDPATKNDAGSVYVFVHQPDGSWAPQAKLIPNDNKADDQFGYAVAISGNTIFVGAAYKNTAKGNNAGMVYVFERSGTTWTQTAEFEPNDGTQYNFFGASIVLTAAGDKAYIGATGAAAAPGPTQGGSVYEFVRSGSAWTQQAKLIPNDPKQDALFGRSLVLSSSEDTLVVGAYYFNNGMDLQTGAAYVFSLSGGTWTQQDQLIASDAAAGDYFGFALAVSGDTAIIGAAGKLVGADAAAGKVYVFKRTGTTWKEKAKLNASDHADSNYFGASVALSGTTLLIGATGVDSGMKNSVGAVYVFEGADSAWSEKTKLVTTDPALNDHFGTAIALSGSNLLISAPYKDPSGAVYAFEGSGISWMQQQKLTMNKPTGLTSPAEYGRALAISGDTVVIGAPEQTYPGSSKQFAGLVYVFFKSNNNWELQATLTPKDPEEQVRFGYSVALAGDTLLVGTPWKDSVKGKSAGTVYAFERINGKWSQKDVLFASDGADYEYFGTTIALSALGDRALIGKPCINACSGAAGGAVYEFTRSGSLWNQSKDKLMPDDPQAGAHFGGYSEGYSSLALSGDGDTAVVGAPAWAGIKQNEGAVYVFTWSGTTWKQQIKLRLGTAAEDDWFGTAVALSGDTVLIGAPGRKIGANDHAGATYVFERSGTSWSQTHELTASDGMAGAWFGYALALEGNNALIGAHLQNNPSGEVYLFTRSGGSWAELFNFTAPMATDTELGAAVALSNNTFLFAAPSGGTGSVYVTDNPDYIFSSNFEN